MGAGGRWMEGLSLLLMALIMGVLVVLLDGSLVGGGWGVESGCLEMTER